MVRDLLLTTPQEVNNVSEIKRKKGESFESYIRRVKRRWQMSGKILQARKIKYFEPAKSKNLRKKKRVQLLHRVSKTAYLQKIGRLPVEEEDQRGGFKRKKK